MPNVKRNNWSDSNESATSNHSKPAEPGAGASGKSVGATPNAGPPKADRECGASFNYSGAELRKILLEVYTGRDVWEQIYCPLSRVVDGIRTGFIHHQESEGSTISLNLIQSQEFALAAYVAGVREANRLNRQIAGDILGALGLKADPERVSVVCGPPAGAEQKRPVFQVKIGNAVHEAPPGRFYLSPSFNGLTRQKKVLITQTPCLSFAINQVPDSERRVSHRHTGLFTFVVEGRVGSDEALRVILDDPSVFLAFASIDGRKTIVCVRGPVVENDDFAKTHARIAAVKTWQWDLDRPLDGENGWHTCSFGLAYDPSVHINYDAEPFNVHETCAVQPGEVNSEKRPEPILTPIEIGECLRIF
jgi:hypothetical protein